MPNDGVEFSTVNPKYRILAKSVFFVSPILSETSTMSPTRNFMRFDFRFLLSFEPNLTVKLFEPPDREPFSLCICFFDIGYTLLLCLCFLLCSTNKIFEFDFRLLFICLDGGGFIFFLRFLSFFV